MGLKSWARRLVIKKVVVPEVADQLDEAAASIGKGTGGVMKAKLLKWGEAVVWFVVPVVIEEVSRQMQSGKLNWPAIGALSLATVAAYLRKQAVT